LIAFSRGEPLAGGELRDESVNCVFAPSWGEFFAS
jgi:hypothetical protein